MTNIEDKNTKNIIQREKDFHENYYAEAIQIHSSFNFQVPSIWIEKAKNPSSRPLDYWEYAFHLLGDLEGKMVAEIGCGDGWISTCLASAGAHVYAFDISKNACLLTREKLRAHGFSPRLVSVMDAHSMAFKNSTFDIVFIAGVLHHLDIDKVSKEFYRILKDGGIMVCYEPLKYGLVMWTIRKIYLYINRMKEYTATEDERPLEDHEFDPFKNLFNKSITRKFNFIAKTNRLRKRFGIIAKSLRWVDYCLLSTFPFLNKYCTCIVCRYEK